MSSERKCMNCINYSANTNECRRNSPRLQFDRFDNNMRSSVWPPVDGEDWCGEFKANPQHEMFKD